MAIVGIFLWLALSFAIGALASGKNRSFAGWLLISLIISPLLAGFFLLIAGPKPKEASAGPVVAADVRAESKKCPACAETIKLEAIKCRFCGHTFDGQDVARQVADAQKMRGYALVENGSGMAYCIKCHGTSPVVGMVHHRASDTYYHKECLG